MQAFKSVTQRYTPTPEINQLLIDFRQMVNTTIRIALAENLTARFPINRRCYHEFECYPYHTNFRLSAVNVAVGIIRNYRKSLRKHPETKKPYVTRLTARMFGETILRIEKQHLWFYLRPNRSPNPLAVAIPLHERTLQTLTCCTLNSVTLTPKIISIAYSKETTEITPTGLIGLDRNLNNVTTANLEGHTTIYNLSEATAIKLRYKIIRSHFKRNDVRIRKKLFAKYGKRQRNRVNKRLHLVSKEIVRKANTSNSAVVMENIRGIRKLYRKGNGQGNHYRSRLNSWSFFELQRQIDYKSKWLGIPVVYVHPAKTSSTCAICGSEITECTERKVWCSRCMKAIDRDENAALNIVKRGIISMPNGFASEAMVQESSKGVILKVDAKKCNPYSLGFCIENK